MRSLFTGLVLMVCLLLAGCGSRMTNADFNEKLHKLFPVDNTKQQVKPFLGGREEVIEALGKPDSVRDIGGNVEVWTYRLSNAAIELRLGFVPAKDGEPAKVNLGKANVY